MLNFDKYLAERKAALLDKYVETVSQNPEMFENNRINGCLQILRTENLDGNISVLCNLLEEVIYMCGEIERYKRTFGAHAMEYLHEDYSIEDVNNVPQDVLDDIIVCLKTGYELGLPE